MSQLDSARFDPDSDALLSVSHNEAVEPGELSSWTPVQAIVQISEADRQILEIHVEQLVDELVSRELDHAFTEPTYANVSGVSWSASPALALPSKALSYPLALPAASNPKSTLAVFIPSQAEHPPLSSAGVHTASIDAATSQLQNLQNQGWQDRVLLGSGILALLVMLTGSLFSQLHGFPLRFSSGTSMALKTNRDPFLDYLQKALQRVNTESAKPLVNQVATANHPLAPLAQAPVPPGNPVTIPLPSTQPPPVQSGVHAHPSAPHPLTAAAPPASIPEPPKPLTQSSLPQIPIATLPPPPPMGELTLSLPSLSPAGTGGLLPPPPSGGSEQIPQTTGITSPPDLLPVAVVAPSKMATPPAPNRPARTLTGVMQMADQSLALIEVNGVTRRIRLGEVISADGAVLMQVGEQEAIVQKGQEQYTIQVGQRF